MRCHVEQIFRVEADLQPFIAIGHSQLFIRSTDEDRPARRITSSSARERDLAWSPDGQTLYFVRDDEGGLGSIFTAHVELAREDIVPGIAEADEAEDADANTDEDEAADEDDTDGDEDDHEAEGDADDDHTYASIQWATSRDLLQ